MAFQLFKTPQQKQQGLLADFRLLKETRESLETRLEETMRELAGIAPQLSRGVNPALEDTSRRLRRQLKTIGTELEAANRRIKTLAQQFAALESK